MNPCASTYVYVGFVRRAYGCGESLEPAHPHGQDAERELLDSVRHSL